MRSLSEFVLRERLRMRGLRLLVLTIGWLLSPLTFWNDGLINLPLAVLIAAPLIRHTGLDPVTATAIAYVATNLLGFLLMGFALLLPGRGEARRAPESKTPVPRDAANGLPYSRSCRDATLGRSESAPGS